MLIKFVDKIEKYWEYTEGTSFFLERIEKP